MFLLIVQPGRNGTGTVQFLCAQFPAFIFCSVRIPHVTVSLQHGQIVGPQYWQVFAVLVPFTWLVLDTTEVCGEVVVIEAEFRR